MANQMGKRYTCAECEATVLVTKAGDGELTLPRRGHGDRPGQAAPVLRLTEPPHRRRRPRARGASVNIAMILEMAADALGDRVAFGTRADGLTYDDLRNTARAVAERIDDDHGAAAARAHGAASARWCPPPSLVPRGPA